MDRQDERPAPAPEVEPKPSEQMQLANQENGHRSGRRYTTTAKKAAANRKNAQHSTGPRTAAGKLAVRLNAVKHGVLCKEVLGSGVMLGESPDHFESLLSGLNDVYKPVGMAEELAVEEIAVTYIRRARALRAERAETERAQRESDVMETVESLRLSAFALQFPESFSALVDILRSPVVVKQLTEACAEALGQLKLGQISQEPIRDIDRFLRTNFIKDSDATDSDFSKLEQWLIQLKSALEQSAAALEENRNLRRLGKSLPPTSVIDRVIRYESMLDRQMMRAVQWLEILQQRRRALEVQNG